MISWTWQPSFWPRSVASDAYAFSSVGPGVVGLDGERHRVAGAGDAARVRAEAELSALAAYAASAITTRAKERAGLFMSQVTPWSMSRTVEWSMRAHSPTAS